METSAVAKVIRACLDDERTLVHESKRLDAQRSAVLIRLAAERRRFAEELERVNGQGSRESWRSLAAEVGNDLWAEMAGHNPGDAVAACRRSQRRTEECYDSALELEMPSGIRTALVVQQGRVVAAGHELAEIEYVR